MINAISVDVEDWYHSIENIKFGEWDKYESRIVRNVEKVLQIFSDYNVKATFFVLGYVAEKHPEVVKMISAEKHEIGTHGYSHRLIYNLNKNEFASELRKSIEIIENLSGQKVLGHRAPAWSITDRSEWALDIIFDHGLLYDSSISPFVCYLYGIRGYQKQPGIIMTRDNRNFYEFPLSTVSIFKKEIPAGGGFFTRLYPYWFMKYNFKKINSSGDPAGFYFHPWDLDVGQPRLKLPFRMKRHYYNLETTEIKIRNLLTDFEFAPISEVLLKKSKQ